jgi:uncharacterized RDD family membrane protein YckC
MAAHKTGFIYRKSDYAGVIVRILIDLMDFTTLGISCLATIAIASYSGVEQPRVLSFLGFAWIILGFVYLGPLKATGIPTLGYRIFKVKLVNAQGGKADFWQASGRALFLFFGPANFLLDLFWIYGEAPRQALRDKFSGTYLIKNSATIVSQGKVASKVLHVMGYRMRIEEIQIHTEEKAGAIA